MNNDPKRDLSILTAALALGLADDALLRCTPWGANFALWAGLLTLVLMLFGFSHERLFAKGGAWLAAPSSDGPAGVPLARIHRTGRR